MKPHPRIRKTIKWGGAAVTVLLVVVWIGSGFGRFGYIDSARWFIVTRGAVSLFSFENRPLWPGDGKFIFEYDPVKLSSWWFSTDKFGYALIVTIPLWPFLSAFSLSSAFAWRLDTLARRRAKLNLCAKCGYDRTGLIGGKDGGGAKCPECGAVPENK